MKKDNMDERLQQYLDLSLQHSEKVSLEKSLETDAEARAELDKYRVILDLLQQEEEVEPPADFTEQIMQALPDSVERPKQVPASASGEPSEGSSNWIRPLLALGGIAAAVGVLMVFPGEPEPQKETMRPALVAHSELGQKSSTPAVVLPVAEESSEQAPVALSKLELEVLSGVIRVQRKEGRVDTLRSGQNTELSFMDEVETGIQSSARVVWPDDAVRLKLKPRTRVQVAHTSIRLHHGDSWVNVVRKGTNFEVQTPNLVAAVRGTMFSASVRYSTESLQRTMLTQAFGNSRPAMGSLNATGEHLRKGLGFFASTQNLEYTDPRLRSSRVNVFEGVVNVKALDSAQDESQNLFAGDAVASRGPGWIGPAEDVDERVWLRWGQELEVAGVALSSAAEQAQESGTYTETELELNHEILPENTFGEEFID